MFLHIFLKSAFIVLFLPSFAFSSDKSFKLPFQKCEKDREEFTHYVTKKSGDFNILQPVENRMEGGSCFYCYRDSEKSSVARINLKIDRLANRKDYKSEIPYECFLAASLRGVSEAVVPEDRSTYCEDKNFENENYTGEKKHCINKAYVDAISSTFFDMSYCFNLNKQDQVDFFYLINHESGFILNAKSETGATCLGQLTSDYVEEINEKIKGQRKAHYPHFYKEVLDRCPGLEAKVLSNLKYVDCKTTHDPYTCLFYTFFDLKTNYNTIVESLNEPLDYMGKRGAFSKTMKQAFQLPLKLNEILLVKGVLRGKKVNWVFWDDSELFDLIQKYKWTEEALISLEVTKLPLFQDSDKISRMINLWAHNGGGSVARNTGRIMVRKLKQAISRGCPKTSKTRICAFRKKIQSGESLSAKEAYPYFRSYLLKRYPSESSTRKKQVANYVRKIISDSDVLFDKESDSKDRYQEEFLDIKENLNGTKKDQNQFVNHFREICPRASL